MIVTLLKIEVNMKPTKSFNHKSRSFKTKVVPKKKKSGNILEGSSKDNKSDRGKNKFKQRPKELNKKKKTMVPDFHKLHQIVGEERPPDEEETALQQYLFGADTFSDIDVEEEKAPEHEKEKGPNTSLKPAWVDEDDEKLLVKDKVKSLKKAHRSLSLRGEEKYSDYVQEKFIKIMGTPDWANLEKSKTKKSDDEMSGDDLLQKTGNFIQESESLSKGKIHLTKCPSLVNSNMKVGIIKSVEFHPTSRVAVVAASNGFANLFQVDGKINAKIQTIALENFPLYMAHFSSDGSELFLGSNKFGHFFSYDMMGGKITNIPHQKGMDQWNMRRFHVSPDGKYLAILGHYGQIHLMTVRTKEWVGSLKMNGEVCSLTFNRDGTRMYSHGSTGEVYVWDMTTRTCIHKFVDNGCLTGTALAISPNEQFLASGSDSGVVNIYDHSQVLLSTSPNPMRMMYNLTTEVSSLKFNHSSEMLLAASCFKKDAVKIVHFPSMNVFSNFPNGNINHPNSIDISPNSGFICIGNNIGTSYIYRVKHFKNY